MAAIKVNVVSACESVFSGEAELVTLPGAAGELEIASLEAELSGLAAELAAIRRIKGGV